MKIELALSPEVPGARQVGAVTVLPVAADVGMRIRFVNDGDGELVVDSPASSQDALLWLRGTGAMEPAWFMLNPSRIDSQGEITAPLPATVRLAPRQAVERNVTLRQFNLDRWLEPGAFEVWVEFLGKRSNILQLAAEIRADSVPGLVDLALAGPDSWIREKSMEMLSRIPGAPAPVLPSADTAAHVRALEQYGVAVQRFLADWDRLQNTSEVRAALARLRAESWLAR